MYCIELKDESDTLKLGQLLGESLKQAAAPLSVVFLKGDLGMGKTTLCRGLLGAFDYNGAVKSPTYTLVEEYALVGHTLYHFDIYRLGDPEELEYMGIRDFLCAGEAPVTCIIEWPEKGRGVLPSPDLEIVFGLSGEVRQVELHMRQSLQQSWSDSFLAACKGAFKSAEHVSGQL